MAQSWISTVFIISLLFLAALKTEEVNQLQTFIRFEKPIRIEKFSNIKKNLAKEEQNLFKLWEAMLTGQSRSLDRAMKSEYTYLGLNHLFSPSGFHLSAILTPVFWLTRSKTIKLSLLLLIGILLIRTPGLSALKRMVLVKVFQTRCNIKLGFIIALMIDLLFGTFQSTPISFTYSFLFLGIIYSGIKGIKLIFLFFSAQILIAYFLQNQLSFLIIFWSPILNFLFGIIMPVLMVLSFPLLNWQLNTGLFLLSKLNSLTHFAYQSIVNFPQFEVHFGMLLMMILFLRRRWQLLIISVLFLSNTLNTEKRKLSFKNKFDITPLSDVVKIKNDKIYFKNERCRQELITGHWNIKCSPIKRST